MISQDDMDGIIGAIRGVSANVNQIALRANKNGKIYDENIADMKAKLEEIWQLLNYIRSGVRCVNCLKYCFENFILSIDFFQKILYNGSEISSADHWEMI